MKHNLWIISALCFALLVMCFIASRVAAQKAERGTTQWTIDLSNASSWAGGTRVHVLDTSGVCLYVVRQPNAFDAGITIAIAAVPKTALPQGAGCQ